MQGGAPPVKTPNGGILPKKAHCQKCGAVVKVKTDGTPYKHTRQKFRRDPDTDERQTVTVDCTGSK